ncbi:Regulator of chromosome condensation (RCC1) repeat protein [compost metagenome]
MTDTPKWNYSQRRIGGLENVASVVMGRFHALVLTKDGKLFAWGCNSAGQLGDKSFKDSAVPIRVQLP